MTTPDPSSGAPPSADERPREAKVLVVLVTILAAVLCFFGVLYLVMVDRLQAGLSAALDDAGSSVSVTAAGLRTAIRVAGGLLLVVGLVNGAAAQALRSRRRWSRPVGYAGAGVVCVLGVLSLATGAANVPVVILTGLAAVCLYFWSKPAVTAHLRR